MKTNIAANVTTTIKAPSSKVWEALTKPEIIKQYFFGTNTETDWKPGSPNLPYIRENFGPAMKHKSGVDYSISDHFDHVHFSVDGF